MDCVDRTLRDAVDGESMDSVRDALLDSGGPTLDP